jgi:hypothetical protein
MLQKMILKNHGSYMFESSVSKDMKKKGCNKGGGSRESGGAFISSNTNYQRIEN